MNSRPKTAFILPVDIYSQMFREEDFRGLLLGGPVAGPLAWTAGWAVLLLVVFVPLAMRAYRRRV